MKVSIKGWRASIREVSTSSKNGGRGTDVRHSRMLKRYNLLRWEGQVADVDTGRVSGGGVMRGRGLAMGFKN